VAGEIDLAWSYAGAPTGLIGQLVADARIQATARHPDGDLATIEDWVAAQAERPPARLRPPCCHRGTAA
jgi:hypothetical protein